VAVIGSVLSTRYQGALNPVLAGRHVPPVVAQQILGSLGGARAVARAVGGRSVPAWPRSLAAAS
jgi:4'-phosphopantetheinyl transferase EntD